MKSELEISNDWLTLSEASKLLGVHPATVRQWSDEGKIGAFRTPGGHRRFVRDDIERLLNKSPVRGSGLQTYLFDETIERTRKSLPEALGRAEWAKNLPEAARSRWRLAGRQLVTLVGRLVTHEELNAKEYAAALNCGSDYGQVMAELKLSLPDAVLAFLFFRDSLIETVLQLPETTGLQRSETLTLLNRANALLSEVLRAMMDAFTATEQLQADTPPASEEAIP